MYKEIKLSKNLKEVKKYNEFFNFNPSMNNTEDINENLDKEVTITHKRCGHQDTEILSQWIKKAPYRASRLKFFKTDDINLTCPKCSTDKLQKQIDSLYNKEFEIKGFFINTKTKIKIKHVNCNGVFDIGYESLVSGKMKCKSCKTNNIEQNKSLKQEEFLNKLKVNNMEDIIPQETYKGDNEEILFLHKKCNKTFKETPHNLLRRKNKCPHCNIDSFIINSSDKKFKEDKIKIMQKNMDKYHKDKFKLIDINSKDKTIASIKCLTCDKEFTDYRSKLYSEKLICPYCNITKNNFISSKDKIDIYNKKLNGKFEILERFTSQSDKINLKRIACGHTIKRTLNEVLSSKYKDVCPECNRLKRLDDLNNKLKLKYNDRFKVINGLSEYKNNRSLLLFLDKKCGERFISSFTNILNNKYFKCPSCEIEDETKNIKSQVYDKFKGEYLMLSEYIDSDTPIKFKHVDCNHIFFKTKNQFFNSKTPCKYCSQKSRSLGIKKAQNKINNKFGTLFSLKGVYTNNYTNMPILCNSCGNIEDIALVKLMSRNGCKNCKTQTL